MSKIDFVTIFFNDPVDMNLIKLQAASFSYVDENMIHKIYLAYNDIGNGRELYESIKTHYPENIRDKIVFVSRSELGLDFLNVSTWVNQQLVKIKFCHMIDSLYYVVLDSKNHFICNVSYNTFFVDDKPLYKCFLYSEPKGSAMSNPLNYYIELFHLQKYGIFISSAVTPYVFSTKIVKDLIDHIEKIVKIPIDDFLLKNKEVSEFYLYWCYLLYLKNNSYSISNNIREVCLWQISVKNLQPDEFTRILKNKNISSFAIHRLVLKNEEYVKKILEFGIIDNFYGKIYDSDTVDFIKKCLIVTH